MILLFFAMLYETPMAFKGVEICQKGIMGGRQLCGINGQEAVEFKHMSMFSSRFHPSMSDLICRVSRSMII